MRSLPLTIWQACASGIGNRRRNSMALNAEDDWEPPSQSEMKVIQARRERQDKISKLMGGYLLKGYRMLGECCEECSTILMQDKHKKNYCVACQELDSDMDKDNPALNAQAALSQVRERQLASNLQTNHNGTPPSVPSPSATSIQPRPEHCEGAASGLRALPPVLINPAPAPAPSSTVPASVPQVPAPIPIPVVASPSPNHVGPFPNALESAEDALLQKLQWATRELQHATSIESSVQLCNLIRSCAESLRSIKELQL
ncbi:protein ZNRD2 [Huso huso]|uniref:Protein ZNRD2 n=1 Tax=Huso huso TaxID=61971 RepID=A0ABR0YZH8_HUSHU